MATIITRIIGMKKLKNLLIFIIYGMELQSVKKNQSLSCLSLRESIVLSIGW
jgi:hypothetical protein